MPIRWGADQPCLLVVKDVVHMLRQSSSSRMRAPKICAAHTIRSGGARIGDGADLREAPFLIHASGME